jgi:iron complex outermembrane receptor protein
LHASYQLAANIELFGNIQNLFNEKYATFGTFFDPARIPFLGLSDPRTLTPAPPLAVFAGLRVRF